MPFNNITSAIPADEFYEFNVDHSDLGHLVDSSELGDGDVRVVGPSFNKAAQFVSSSSNSDAKTITVRYRVPGPIKAANNGQFSVQLQPGEVFDNQGNTHASAVEVGSFSCLINAGPVDSAGPQATLKNFTDIASATSAYDFQIEFTDDVAVDIGTFSNATVRVFGSDFDRNAEFLGTVENNNAQRVTATFRLVENFNSSFNNSYTIQVRANGVRDTSGKGIAQTNVGIFTVSISANAVDISRPTVEQKSFPAIVESASFYDFTLTFRDNDAVKASTVGAGGIVFEGENGFSQTPLFLGASSADAPSIIASYRIQNSFSSGLNGDYQVIVEDDSVADVTGNRNLRAVVGTVTVAINAGSDNQTVPIDSNVVMQRTIKARSLGYNNNLLSIEDYDAIDMQKYGESIRAAGGDQVMRVPGGDTANYWDWKTGGLVLGAQREALPFSPGICFFPSPPCGWPEWKRYPGSIAYRDYQRSNTIRNIKRLVTACGDPDVIWVINTLMSPDRNAYQPGGYQYEADGIQALLNEGVNVIAIEIGNENYYAIPTYQFGHATSEDYARDCLGWLDTMAARHPNIPCLITAKDEQLPGPNDRLRTNWWREGTWNPWIAEVKAHERPNAKAITIHPYYGHGDIGITAGDIGNRDRASAIAAACYSKITERITMPSLSVFPDDQEIWVTETTITGEPEEYLLGQTWLFALIIFQNHACLYKQRNVSTILQHVISGNIYWDAVSTENGETVDVSRIGQESKPSRAYESLATNLLGKAQKLWADVFAPGGDAYLLVDEPCFIGWRVVNAGHDKIAICNINNSAKSLVLPRDRASWNAAIYSTNPWSGQTQPSEFVQPTSQSNITTLTLPPFSLVILDGQGDSGSGSSISIAPSASISSVEIIPADAAPTAFITSIEIIQDDNASSASIEVTSTSNYDQQISNSSKNNADIKVIPEPNHSQQIQII